MNLSDKKCVPCEGGTPPLSPDEIQLYVKKLQTSWEVIENKKLKQRFQCKGFDGAMQFVNKVADIARAENHHPTITINFNKVTITLTTHSIGGLSENDFIIAAKIEKL